MDQELHEGFVPHESMFQVYETLLASLGIAGRGCFADAYIVLILPFNCISACSLSKSNLASSTVLSETSFLSEENSYTLNFL